MSATGVRRCLGYLGREDRRCARWHSVLVLSSFRFGLTLSRPFLDVALLLQKPQYRVLPTLFVVGYPRNFRYATGL